MKILLIDAISCFLDFAMRCEASGHDVRWWIPVQRNGKKNPIGDGLATKVNDWKPSMEWADIIICSDNARIIKDLEPYRKKGYPIFGPNIECSEWELNRSQGVEIFEQAGIECIPSIPFKSYSDAGHYLSANPKRYVCKPDGDVDKALSYVSKGPADLAFMLEHWKRTLPRPQGFIFQEFVPGIEMAVGCFVGRNGFSRYVLENFEFKKLMPGDCGPNTGEMGTVMRYVKMEDSLLAQRVLESLEPELIRQGYTGFIDVSVIIDKDGNPWPLEFTTRPGWPLFQIQQILHKEPVCWMKDLLDGDDTFEPYDEVAVGIVMAIPDFPYGRLPKEDVSGFPVWNLETKKRYFYHPSELKLGHAPTFKDGKLVDEPVMVSAGNYLLTVTGCGRSVVEAKDMAYENMKEIIIPNSPMYRNDIGCRLESQLKELQGMGYATGWKWE